ncbi:MAG: small multi-drug export protein [Clostridiales bacterium]|jgi:uncharacterized membrane protein|nr:small multi-drug export protein [Clostridiales bacterium]
MAEFLIEFINSFSGNNVITVMILSVVPFIELRGAIPFAFGLGMTPFTAWSFCLLSATAAIPVILCLFSPAVKLLKRCKSIEPLVSAVEEIVSARAEKLLSRTKKKKRAKVRSVDFYRCRMLFVLSALPIPLTGIWSGCAIASILGTEKFKAFAAIALGNLVSSAFLTILMNFFAAQAPMIINIMIAGMIAVVFYTILRVARRTNKERGVENKES